MRRLPRVYPILDTAALDGVDFSAVEAAEALLEGGAEILQFRHKEFWSGAIFDQAAAISERCCRANAVFIINDRADFAAMLGAGLHVGQEDLTCSDARRVVGSSAMLGFSTHNESQLRSAAAEPADYVAFGPIFGTQSKLRADPVVGVGSLAHVRVLTNRPLVAIGGVSYENAARCWANGADSVALIGALFSGLRGQADLRRRMEAWRRLPDAL